MSEINCSFITEKTDELKKLIINNSNGPQDILSFCSIVGLEMTLFLTYIYKAMEEEEGDNFDMYIEKMHSHNDLLHSLIKSSIDSNEEMLRGLFKQEEKENETN